MSLVLALAAAPSLDAILNVADLRGGIVGAVVAAPDGRVLWARNPDVRLMPASNQKLFTVAFALDTLGAGYRSETRFWRDAETIAIDSDGTLDVSYARMRAFAERFGRRPKVALWQAYANARPESWQLGDAPNRYAPAVDAFSVERAGVELWANAAGELEMRPAPLGTRIAAPGLPPGWTETRPIAKGFRYDTIDGVVYPPANATFAPGLIDTLSQPSPDLAAARLFLRAGDGEGDGTEIRRVSFDPRLVRKRAPDATLLADPLSLVAGRCLKPSDNFLAEQLLMMATRRKIAYPAQTDYTTAPAKFAAWARSRVGLPDRAFDPADGSGLSRKDLVTARSVARLLNWSKKRSWGPVYLAALARPGEGTLRGRLGGVRFRGKTGTLTGACSLAGLVRGRSGRELAVSLLMNHYPCSTARVRAIQDEFVRRVAATY